jgi:hypothetical protein
MRRREQERVRAAADDSPDADRAGRVEDANGGQLRHGYVDHQYGHLDVHGDHHDACDDHDPGKPEHASGRRPGPGHRWSHPGFTDERPSPAGKFARVEVRAVL